MHPFYILVGQGGEAPPVQVDCEMHVHWWIQQVTTRVGAVTCWIQQPVPPKQVVGFTCVLNSEVDQLIRKFMVVVTKAAVRARIKRQSKTKTKQVISNRIRHLQGAEQRVRIYNGS